MTDLDRALAAADRPVMLDFYADWCVSCKEMERFTFSDPRVQQRMQKMLLLQADVTANTPEDAELLKRFGLFGPDLNATIGNLRRFRDDVMAKVR